MFKELAHSVSDEGLLLAPQCITEKNEPDPGVSSSSVGTNPISEGPVLMTKSSSEGSTS